MPNHVTNRLTITGTKEQIDAFEAAFIKPEPPERGESEDVQE